MAAPEQNIVDVSWDYKKFDEQTQLIIADMKAVYEAAKKMTDFKIAPGSTGGFTELNAKVKDMEANTVRLAAANAKLETQLQKNTAVTIKQAKDIDNLSNYYKELGLAIKDAQIKYYNLAGELGRNHPLSQAALKDANDLRAIQKQLAEDTGVYTHSVGNYSGALTNFALTARGLRGPTKLLGEALGIGAQEADQFRLVLEHAAQGIAAFFKAKENKAGAEVADTAATAANTAATEVNTLAKEKNAAVGVVDSVSGAIESEAEATEALSTVQEFATGVQEINTTATEVGEKAKEAYTVATEAVAVVTGHATVATEGATIAETELAVATTAATASTSANTVVTSANAATTNTAAVSNQVLAASEYEVAAATTAASTSMKVFRTALILSGIGIFVAAIGYLAYSFYQLNKVNEEAYFRQKVLKQVFEDVGKEAGAQVAKIDLLKTVITNLNEPLQKRIDAVNEYNKLADEGNKIDEKQIDNLTEVNKQIEKQIQLIGQRAIAKAFENQLDLAAGELVKAQVKQQLELGQINKSLANADKEVAKNRDASNARDLMNQRDAIRIRKENNDKEVVNAQKKYNDLLKLAQNFVNFDVLTKTDETDGSKQISDLIKRESKAFDIYKKYLSYRISLLKDSLDTDKDFYTEKIKLLDEYINKENLLINKEANALIKAAKAEEIRQLANLEKDKKGKNKEQVARINENEGIIAYNTAQKILDINADRDIKLKQKEVERTKFIEKLYNERLSNIAKINKYEIESTDIALKAVSSSTVYSFEERINAYSEYYKNERKLLQDDFDLQVKTGKLKGEALLVAQADLAKKQSDLAIKSKKDVSDILISSQQDELLQSENIDKLKLSQDELALYKSLQNKQKFAKEAQKLELQQQKDTINNQIYSDKEIILSTKSTEEEKKKAAQRILDNQIKLNQLELSEEQKKEAAKLANKEIYYQLETKAVETFFSLYQKLSDAAYEKRIKQLEAEAKKLDDNYNKEVSNISNSTISAQEKAAQLTILEKKHAAEKQAIADKEKQEKIKQAKTDKAIGIAKIVVETALAVVHALTTGDPYTAYARAALSAAAGAAALAEAIATPIPSYYKETDNHPGGPARYGEIPEVVTEPGKRPYVQWTETIGMLPRGTKVKHLTSENVMDAAGGAMVSGTAERLAMAERAEAIRNNDRKFDELKDAVLTTGAMQVQAIRKMKQGQTNITVNGMWNAKIEREVRR